MIFSYETRAAAVALILGLAGSISAGCASESGEPDEDVGDTEEGADETSQELRGSCYRTLGISCTDCTATFARSRCAAYGRVVYVSRTSGGYRCRYVSRACEASVGGNR